MPDWTKLKGNLFDIAFQMDRLGTTVDLIRRKGVPPAAGQKVIIAEEGTQAREMAGPAGKSGRQFPVLIGYRAYAGQTDFDVKHGDTFVLGGTEYRVTYVDDLIPGRREAYTETTQ